MSDLNVLIERLNHVMSWELAGSIQYLHHATVLRGVHRAAYAPLFEASSRQARDRAQAVAERVAALGGVPTTQPARVRIAGGVEDMLEAALALQEDALEAWESAYELAGLANPGTQFWTEERVAQQQSQVDALRKMTGRVHIHALDGPSGSASGE